MNVIEKYHRQRIIILTENLEELQKKVVSTVKAIHYHELEQVKPMD